MERALVFSSDFDVIELLIVRIHLMKWDVVRIRSENLSVKIIELRITFFPHAYLLVILRHADISCDEEYRCDNGQCIQRELLCDQAKNCRDGSDEMYCRHNKYFPRPGKS